MCTLSIDAVRSRCRRFAFEYEHARSEGSKSFCGMFNPLSSVAMGWSIRLELTKLVPAADGAIIPQHGSEFFSGSRFSCLSIGQGTHSSFLSEYGNRGSKVQLERGRILIDRATGQTSYAKFFAGGDCTTGGREVVDAVRTASARQLASPHVGGTACPNLNRHLKPSSAVFHVSIRSGLLRLRRQIAASRLCWAFDAGWVERCVEDDWRPITNVSSRYSSIDWEGRRMMGFNNIELISDPSTEVNLQEIAEVSGGIRSMLSLLR